LATIKEQFAARQPIEGQAAAFRSMHRIDFNDQPSARDEPGRGIKRRRQAGSRLRSQRTARCGG